jgi:hypothetical protein
MCDELVRWVKVCGKKTVQINILVGTASNGRKIIAPVNFHGTEASKEEASGLEVYLAKGTINNKPLTFRAVFDAARRGRETKTTMARLS